jgi:HK97 family phage major capsid protein
VKTLEELIDSGDILPSKEIIAQVLRAGRPILKAIAACRVNRDLIRTKQRSLWVPKAGQVTAAYVAEGAAGDATTMSYTLVEIPVLKYKVRIPITQEALDGSQIDLINDLVNDTGKALALIKDEVIVAELIDSGNYTVAATQGEKEALFDAIMRTKALMIAENVVPKIVIMDETAMSELLLDERIAYTQNYGDRRPVLEGEVLRFGGLNVLITQNAPSTKVVLVDPDVPAAYFAQKRDVELKRWDDPSTDSIELNFYEEYGVGVVAPDAVGILTLA